MGKTTSQGCPESDQFSYRHEKLPPLTKGVGSMLEDLNEEFC
jgi:hypothetical protein